MSRLWLCAWLALTTAQAAAQQDTSTQELIGQMGSRATVMNLYTTSQPDGSARVTSDYLLLPTRQMRYLAGERSKQLGEMSLNEGNSPILYGRPPTATLRGTWLSGVRCELAEGYAESCGSQGYLEPVLVDRRGNCHLMRAQR